MVKLPEKTKQDLAEVAANFAMETGAKVEAIQVFMVNVIRIYNEFLAVKARDYTH